MDDSSEVKKMKKLSAQMHEAASQHNVENPSSRDSLQRQTQELGLEYQKQACEAGYQPFEPATKHYGDNIPLSVAVDSVKKAAEEAEARYTMKNTMKGFF
ncbi:MAG: hypothetical protein CMH26_08105 [Micavibrio sp.]|nr:hypothetical protein [Micavibrio sp.]